MISKKGFLYTISAIILVSTLVFYSQNYLEKNSFREREIVFSSVLNSAEMINDNLAFNLQTLLRLDISKNYDNNFANFIVLGDLNASSNPSTDLLAYKTFVDNNLFNLSGGSKVFTLSNLSDGQAEIFFGNSLEFDYSYDNGFVLLKKSNSGNTSTLNSVDLTLNLVQDINSHSWSSTNGSTVVDVNYIDSNNAFTERVTIDPTLLNTLTITFDDADSITFEVGLISSINNSVKLSNDTLTNINYSLTASYYPDSNNLPALFNSNFSYIDSKIDYNSLVKLFD